MTESFLVIKNFTRNDFPFKEPNKHVAISELSRILQENDAFMDLADTYFTPII